MKKIVLTTLVTLLSVGASFAQKLNFSKSVIYFGKDNPVAKVENQSDGSFIYSDVDGTKVFQVFRKKELTKNNTSFDYIEVKDLQSNESNSVAFETIGFVFSKDAEVFNNISRGSVKLVGDNGIDKTALSEFMKSEKVDFAAKIKHINDSIDNVLQYGASIMKDKKISIDPKNNILEDGKQIGFIKRVKGREDAMGFDIYSKEGDFAIAKWRNKGEVNMEKYFVRNNVNSGMLTYNLLQFVILDEKKDITSPKSFADLALINSMLSVLYANGIDIAAVTREDVDNAIKIAKDNGNIRRAKGYVIGADGQKKEGLISIDFIDESTGNVQTIGGGFGKRMTLYTSEGKKESKETFKASDNVTFFAENSQGKLQEYSSFKVELSNKTLGFLNNISEGVLFHQKIYEKGNLALYRNITGKQWLLKKTDSDTGFFISGAKDQATVIQNVKKLLGCDTINLEGVNLFAGKGLMELIDRYAVECK